MAKRVLPETSKSAYQSLEPDKIRLMYQRIISALEVLGDSSYEEIATHLGEKPERIWRRLSEMLHEKLIHRPGTRKVMASGRTGFAWRLGPGKDVTKQRVKSPKGKSIVDYSRALIQPSINSSLQSKLF